MELTQILILAVVQALTEFLPISSSAHLFLASELWGWDYQGVLFDLGLHLGTLFAVVLWYRREWMAMAGGALAWRPGTALDPQQRLLWHLILATIPAAIAALALSQAEGVSLALRRHEVIAATEIGFGVALWWAWRRASSSQNDEFALDWRTAVMIGCAQCLALVPGTSRSGICMTAALVLGMARPAAARFAFLMAVPIISLGAAHAGLEFAKGEDQTPLADFLIGMVASAGAGLLVIPLFLGTLQRIGMTPFLIYRLGLGALLLWLLVRPVV
ncbi:MAG: undecaprenyl-diphosphate phosphatase [Xanthomonadales bacterium]|nr:undecaprenyl-diphosphate phosphatase [Xanthomonadales bacterium]